MQTSTAINNPLTAVRVAKRTFLRGLATDKIYPNVCICPTATTRLPMVLHRCLFLYIFFFIVIFYYFYFSVTIRTTFSGLILVYGHVLATLEAHFSDRTLSGIIRPFVYFLSTLAEQCLALNEQALSALGSNELNNKNLFIKRLLLAHGWF